MDLRNAVLILAIIAVILSVVGICKPTWPITACACLLTAIALLVLAGHK